MTKRRSIEIAGFSHGAQSIAAASRVGPLVMTRRSTALIATPEPFPMTRPSRFGRCSKISLSSCKLQVAISVR